MARAERLEQLIEPAIVALGYELVGVEYKPQGRHSLLRVYIDRPEGITVDDCERVSHQVSGVLDVEDPIQGQYTLEVSSPGLERPLFRPAHYERFAGSEVQLRLKVPVEGRRKFKGRLLGLRDDAVVLEADGVERVFPLADVEYAHLVPDWENLGKG
ncbi:MAG: ribosome maturation factor RimP [Thiohalomonadaceae bacterium]